MNTLVSPSILAANFLHLDKEFDMLEKSNADWIHVDVMDGVFVPNISFGTPVLKALQKATTKPLDVHLMIADPQRYIPLFASLGAKNLNVHFEACTHLNRAIQEIKDAGMRPCVTLNPSTPISMLEDVIDDLYMVLLMSVNPGFGGQKFIPNTLKKIARLRNMIDERNCNTLIEVDGGINATTGEQCVKAGADVLVAGSFVFSAPDPFAAVDTLKAISR